MHKRIMVVALIEEENETQGAFLTCPELLKCCRGGEILNILQQMPKARLKES